MRYVVSIAFFAVLLLLAGCGGGGGGATDGGANDGGSTGGGGGSEALAAPQSLQESAGSGTVALQWSGVEGADAYALYYATEGGIQPTNFGIWMSQHNGVMTENVTSPHTVGGLNNGTEYFFVVTATSGDQESAPSNEVSAVPREAATVTRKLNDTGIDRCADGLADINRDCPVASYPGQDGDFGRDAAARAGTLLKTGGGAAGFDFTKIANNGSVLPASAVRGSEPNDWACTRDNVTGLIWEVKTLGGLRDSRNIYAWYQPDGPNGGSPGTPGGGVCPVGPCDTHHFVQAVNAQGLCGATDWRLPTLGELHSIVHHGRSGPAVDTDFFPNTQTRVYWSSSPYAISSFDAYQVNFQNGETSRTLKAFAHPVRLVRDGP